MRKINFFLYTVYCLFFTVYCFAQEVPPVQVTIDEQKIEERIEDIATTADESIDFSEIADQLKYFSEHPLNLNNTNKNELLQRNMLTDVQVENLLLHIKQNGKLIALEELQSIEGFNSETINKILPYIKIQSTEGASNASLSEIFGNGTHQVLIRTQRILEDQAGFIPPEGDSLAQPEYPGSPLKLYTRYRFTYLRKIGWGVTAEKDQGEEFFTGTQKSFDFISAHAFIRDLGPVKIIALGDYQLSYGQGLTLWTGLSFGKSAESMGIKKNAQGIYPYTSVNEVFFKRGAAVSIGNKKLTADVFYSDRNLDGNITDTLDQVEQFSSFQESGYHRTESELADKNAVNEKLFGGHLNYRLNNFNVGFTGVHSKYDKSFLQSPAFYNQFYFKGSELTSLGVDYNFLWHNINLFGEFARSDNGAVAYLNGALISLDPRISFSVLNRNYPREYQALYANALREGSNNFNERGTYFGVLIKPMRTITLSGYFDVFTFPWLRYQVNSPSNGYECTSQLTYNPDKRTQIYFRFKQTVKEDDLNSDQSTIDYLIKTNQKNYRFDLVSKISKSVTLHSRAELVRFQQETEDAESGYLIFQDINYKPFDSPVSFSFRYALFDTKSYDTRLYAYESDVLYYYSIPAYYYRGMRYYITLRCKIAKGIDAWIRFAQTAYTNQNTIGSGNDEIEGNKKSEIKIQFRFEF